MAYYDRDDILLKPNDIINIHQTVNGENKFIIKEVNPLDIRYYCDINRRYEYDKEELLARDDAWDIEWEIVGIIV